MACILSAFMVLSCAFSVYASQPEEETASAVQHEDHTDIETALNLQNMNAQWTYSDTADAWTMAPVTAVTDPEIEEQQGVSVCVPGAYVTGIDTDGDGEADVTDGTAEGSLVIDYEAEITSEYGQVYTAATAPVILNTGAAGYGSSKNSNAASTYAKQGYINVSCGNRGKQDTAEAEDGSVYYTGDAPSCLVDQKNAARFVKYNILLGNLPGSTDLFVSTGGSGGGAHAVMFAATSDNPDFYDYEIEAGAVGVYQNEDGSYDTCVNIDGEYVEISDGAWGCVAYSAITSLAEGDIAMAFEYYLDPAYEFSTSFQKQMAEYLAAEYMEYINGQELSVSEEAVGFDLDGDGEMNSTIALTIEYDEEKYADTNGYGGTYLDLYLAEFQENLQWYLDNLDYAEGWTWFDEEGNALSDSEVAAMTSEEKMMAFLEGRTSGGSAGGSHGGPGGGESAGGPGGGESAGGPGGGESAGESEEGESADAESAGEETRSFDNSEVAENSVGDTMDVGTPDAGTTQAAESHINSQNYNSYEEMLTAYQEDIASVREGDQFGNNIVDLYNPLLYIGAEETEDPVWTRIVMGASEGDMSMFASLNLQLAFLNAGTDATIEWQWNGGHVPSEIFGNSLALWVDTMVDEYVDGAASVTKPEADPVTENGTAESPSGKDITSWVDSSDLSQVSFSLADAAAYRTDGASKAIPGFDVIDYGQEDYVFGNVSTDARHWDPYVLKVLEEHQDVLESLFDVE